MALRPSHDDSVPKLDTTEEAHLKLYKNNAKHEDMRRHRNETTVEIRKQKGAELLMKRRKQLNDENEDGDLSDIEDIELPNANWPANEEIINILNNSPTIEQAPSYLEAPRRRLSRSKNPPIDKVIKSGLVHKLVQALSVEDDKMPFGAAWALTYIVSGTHVQTLAIVEAGATLPLIRLTQSLDPILSRQALWAVANIAGDSPQLRDHIIECDGLNALMALVDRLDSLDSSCARTLARTFSNMCLHRNPHAPIPVLEVLSRGLSRLITHPDKKVLHYSCWAISYLVDGPDEQIALVTRSGVLPLVSKLLRDSDAVAIAALLVFGNMSMGSDDLTQCVVDLGVLNEIIQLFERSKSTTVVEECCRLISNIIAGTQSQIQAVIDAGIMPFILKVLDSFGASWAVANLARGGTAKQVLCLLEENAIPILCAALAHSNVDLLNNILETFHALLNAVSSCCPERFNEVRNSVEENGGLYRMERLQESESNKVYHSACRIITAFFDDEVNEEESKSIEKNQLMDYSF